MSPLTSRKPKTVAKVATPQAGSDLLSELPADILGEIVYHFDSARDTYNLSLTCSVVHATIQPYLLNYIELLDLDSCLNRVQYLIAHPELGRFVHELVLRPAYLCISTEKRLAKEEKLARAVELLVPNLHALKRFVWDGFEVPDSFLWASLRKSCPQLKSIGVNWGHKELDPESELFAFDDLVNFSLTTECHEDKHSLETMFNNEPEDLSTPLWTMLIGRCPRLHTLVIGYRGPTLRRGHILNILPISRAIWPDLRSLTLENSLFDYDKSGLGSISLDDFLAAQVNLEHINLQGHSRSILPGQSPPLPPIAKFDDAATRELALFNGPCCWERMPGVIKMVKAIGGGLRKLSIWMDFSELEDRKREDFDPDFEGLSDWEYGNIMAENHIEMLTELLEGCHGLEEFTLVCGTMKWDTFQLQNFTRVLEGVSLPHLKRLEVWKIHKFWDDPLKTAAAKFAQAKPGLKKVVLVTGDYCWDRERMQIAERGIYRFVHGEKGPVKIEVNERGGEFEVASKFLPNRRKHEQRTELLKDGGERGLVRRLKGSLRLSAAKI